jgi:hypothetical protein
MIILVQKEKEQESAEILIDKEGLEFLRNLLNKDWYEPKQEKDGLYDLDHEHLSSKDWGGEELSPQFTSQSAEKINSLKIVYLGKDAGRILA